MKQALATFFFALTLAASTAQNLYFPPLAGNTWATEAPQNLGFCTHRIDSLYQFLEEKNTKSFVLLHDGKIVLEKYFGTYVQDSFFYWASAGKSLTAFLVGQAIDEGILGLSDKSSEYLGQGWSSLTPAQEDQITVGHQITMTTGLDDGVPDDNCTTPPCLIYKAPAGTRWAYHNAPYRLVHDVLEAASGNTLQQFTKSRLLDKVGMRGLWLDHVMYGRARDMARFGLLMQAKGIWNGDTLLHNTDYLNAMTVPSQALNRAYGYLWWLNGQPNYMLPSVQFTFPGPLCPNAPDDMYAALGKNDQKIHVVPSKGWVVVRQGNSSSNSLVPVEFDNEMWAYINALTCSSGTAEQELGQGIRIWPTVSQGYWNLAAPTPLQRVQVYDALGRLHHEPSLTVGTSTLEINGRDWAAGMYRVVASTLDGTLQHGVLIKM